MRLSCWLLESSVSGSGWAREGVAMDFVYTCEWACFLFLSIAFHFGAFTWPNCKLVLRC